MRHVSTVLYALAALVFVSVTFDWPDTDYGPVRIIAAGLALFAAGHLPWKDA